MKQSRFTEEQIIGILKSVEAGQKVLDVTCPNSEYHSNGENCLICWYTPLLGLTTLAPVLHFIRSAKLQRRLVAKTTVWPVVITLPPPRANHHPCLVQIAEPLHIQARITQSSVKAFSIRVLPGAPWVNIHGLHVVGLQPPLHGLRHKFRPIVAAHIRRCPTVAHHLHKHRNDPLRWNARGTLNRHTRARELVRNGQEFQALPMRTPILHTIVRPHLIRTGGLDRS